MYLFFPTRHYLIDMDEMRNGIDDRIDNDEDDDDSEDGDKCEGQGSLLSLP